MTLLSCECFALRVSSDCGRELELCWAAAPGSQYAQSRSAWLRTPQLCSTDVTFAPQVPLDGSSAVPSIPEVFLEAASALEQAGRHQDAIAVCEEVISRTTDLIPRVLRVEERLEQPECSSPGAELAGGLLPQEKESLCCLAWRAAGYLHQGWAWAKLGESKEAVTQFSR